MQLHVLLIKHVHVPSYRRAQGEGERERGKKKQKVDPHSYRVSSDAPTNIGDLSNTTEAPPRLFEVTLLLQSQLRVCEIPHLPAFYLTMAGG